MRLQRGARAERDPRLGRPATAISTRIRTGRHLGPLGCREGVRSTAAGARAAAGTGRRGKSSQSGANGASACYKRGDSPGWGGEETASPDRAKERSCGDLGGELGVGVALLEAGLGTEAWLGAEAGLGVEAWIWRRRG